MSANGLDLIRWSRFAVAIVHCTSQVSVHKRLRKYAAKYRDEEGVENVRKKDSIGSSGDGLLKRVHWLCPMLPF